MVWLMMRVGQCVVLQGWVGVCIVLEEVAGDARLLMWVCSVDRNSEWCFRWVRVVLVT